MSNVYNTEPPTKGKVTIKTTIGDLDIELWPKEAPKAVRNFVQLCLEGYYDGCVFHRVIKDFMAQTGDPTGTGETSDSIYGVPFKDEFHSRLRFNHRGLVACANRNEPHTNGSQFFITLDKCEWLDKKNTIFGKIVGDTVYNMLRLNDLEVDEATDRPFDPPVIRSVEVLWNPFEDIVPRTTAAERRAQEQFKKAAEVRRERKSAKRNTKLLSFGDEAEAEETVVATAQAKIKSAHEVLRGDSALLSPEETPEEVLREREARAAAVTAVQEKLKAGAKRGRQESDSSSDDDSEGGRQAARKHKDRSHAATVVAERVKAAAEKASSAKATREAAAAAALEETEQHPSRGGSRERKRSRSGSSDRSGDSGRKERCKDTTAAAAGVSGDSKPKSKGDQLYVMKEKQGPGRVRLDDHVVDGELLQAFELSRQKYKTRKQQIGNRQKDTLARLAAFTNKLRTTDQQENAAKKQQQQQQDDLAKQAAAAQQTTEAAEPAMQGQDKQPAAAEEAYDGKVREDIDHRSYMPAAWRVDDYLNQQDEDEDDLASLRQHKLEFAKAPGVDAMARSDNLDDYVVFDPLLETAKGKFSRAAQREKKKQTTWAGKGQG